MSGGFLGFQATITTITAVLGEQTLQPVVAKHAMACLELEVRAARKLPSWGGLDWATWWTTCTHHEFDRATDRTLVTLRMVKPAFQIPASHEARWRGAMMRLRGPKLQAEGGGFALQVGRYFLGHQRYDRQLRRDVDQWQVSMDSDFMGVLGHSYTSSKKTVHASTEEGAVKSLRRMAKEYLGAELQPL